MKTSQYVAHEKAIAAADSGGIRQRWLYGLRLLRDPDAMSPGGGGLRHGVGPALVAASKARGLKLSDREIRYRIQCAKTYPHESQIGNAVADFGAWRDLISAGFPHYEPGPGEPPADHRTQVEKDRDAARRLLDLVGEQGSLFPLDQFEPVETTLKDLIDYTEAQEQLTQRFVDHGQKRRDYLDSLVTAVEGDVSKSWQEAHDLAFPEVPA